MQQEELISYCGTLQASAGQAQNWVLANGDIVKNGRESLLRELRRTGRTLRRCETALKRKMCAGVFGPSQAGKSYLLSALAMDANKDLRACFGGKTLDFITEINPEGGKESTGLVTRFTMSRPSQIVDGYPVYLRLLSETDIVKIIANTYYADCDHKELPDEDAIRAALADLEPRVGKQACTHLGLDEMEDLHEYVWGEFSSRARVASLQKLYWDQAAELAPRLALDDRVALYSIIWDDVPQYTSLLRGLLHDLDLLGYASEAFCTLDALTPRETSIIDVAMLAGLGAGGEDKLSVRTVSGTCVDLQRADVTALTAELTIFMENRPAEFFDHTDLLDFPGYRSRYKITEIRKELEKPGMATQMFLRGKVAYLFQRYCAEKELTSMLLCIGPSNQEVQDLPAVINDWIGSTHGKTPDERAPLTQDSLFFILTKFDVEFDEKAGATDTKGRWDNRLHASLLDFFGKQHDWPEHWKPEQAFNNIYLLRNPNFKFDKILEIEEDGNELGIRAAKENYVKELRTSFMESELVRRHFRDPQKAWDAAMKLNDGGIGYIRESLSPLCDPDIKRRQLEKTVFETRDLIFNRLKKFHFSDDKEEEAKKKKAFIGRLFLLFKSKDILRHRFGEMLHSFMLSSDEVYALHSEAERRYNQYLITARDDAETADSSSTEDATAMVESLSLDMFDEAFGLSAENGKQQAAPVAATDVRDEHSFYVEYIFSQWEARMQETAESVEMQAYYAFPAQEFSTLVHEFAVAASRIGLQKELEDDFRLIAQPADVSKDSKVRKQASLAAARLNAFLSWLDMDPAVRSPEERRVSFNGQAADVFADQPPMGEIPSIGENFVPYTNLWYRDWLLVCNDMVMRNVDFDGENTLNREQNSLLGNILERMKGSAPVKGDAA
ncbi:MAG: putative virulence factor [Desulfovibrio sp.]|nr:putative virulence factor [Desulfovibrio sp.]